MSLPVHMLAPSGLVDQRGTTRCSCGHQVLSDSAFCGSCLAFHDGSESNAVVSKLMATPLSALPECHCEALCTCPGF